MNWMQRDKCRLIPRWSFAFAPLVGIGCFFTLLCTATLAQTNPPSAAPAPASSVPPVIEPKADALLKQCCDALAGAKQLRFETRALVDDVTEVGQKIQYAKVITTALRRPDRLVADVKGDLQNYHFVFDGSTINLLDPLAREYSTIRNAPNTTDAMLDFLAEKYAIATPLADLLFSKPYESFCSRVRAGMYLGEHMVDTTPCHHLAFRNDGVDWQIWLDATPGAKPLPRKLVITYKQIPAQPQFMAVFDKWDLNATIPDDAFRFTPPAGAKQVELDQVKQPGVSSAATTQPSGAP